MKNNYLYIIVIVGYIIFSGCGNSYRDFTNFINYKIVNQTDKNLFCEIINATRDSTETKFSFVSPNDSSDILFSNTKKVLYRDANLYYYPNVLFNIYNLNDTSIITQSLILYQNGKFIDNEWIFKNYDDKPENYTNNACAFNLYRLFIDTDKLSLFEKDYSMLGKFPEYYGN